MRFHTVSRVDTVASVNIETLDPTQPRAERNKDPVSKVIITYIKDGPPKGNLHQLSVSSKAVMMLYIIFVGAS